MIALNTWLDPGQDLKQSCENSLLECTVIVTNKNLSTRRLLYNEKIPCAVSLVSTGSRSLCKTG